LKRRFVLSVLVVATLIISVFLYYQFSSNVTLEKSDKGNLPNTTENSVTKFGMFIEENDFSSKIDKIPLESKNYGTSIVTFGTFYSIETFIGDSWYKIPFKDNITFTTQALVLNPGGVHKSIINLDIFSYKFPKGKYRIIKEFTVDESEVTLAAEFLLH
jgi:hypothetical protein